MPAPKPHNSRSLAVVTAKRRWTRADAAVVVAELDRAGESAEAFAARTGLHPERLRRWRRAQPKATKIQFAEVDIAGPTLAAEALRIDVRPGLAEILVLDPARCPPAWLAQLAVALREERA